MYQFGVKALMGRVFISVCYAFAAPTKFKAYQVSRDTLPVALGELNSDTINAVLYFWKCSCVLSFKTLQSAWGKALDDGIYNQKLPN